MPAQSQRSRARWKSVLPYPAPIGIIICLCIIVVSVIQLIPSALPPAASTAGSMRPRMSTAELDAWQSLCDSNPQIWLDAESRRFLRARANGKDLKNTSLAPIRLLSVHSPDESTWSLLPQLQSVRSLVVTAGRISPAAGRALQQMTWLTRVEFIHCPGLLPEHLKYVSSIKHLQEFSADLDVHSLSAQERTLALGELVPREQQFVDHWSNAHPEQTHAAETGILVDRGLWHLADLKNLRSLQLVNATCTSEGFAALEKLSRIEVIDIDVLDDGLNAARVQSQWKELRRVNGANLNNESFALLSTCPQLMELRGWAAGVSIPIEDSISRFAALEHLELRGSRLTFLNVHRILQKSPGLRDLDLSQSDLIVGPESDWLRVAWPRVNFRMQGLPNERNAVIARLSGSIAMNDGGLLPTDLQVVFRMHSALPTGEPEIWEQEAAVSTDTGTFRMDALRAAQADCIIRRKDREDSVVGTVWIKPGIDLHFDCVLGETVEWQLRNSAVNFEQDREPQHPEVENP